MTPLRTIVYLSSATELMTVRQLELLLVEARELNLQNFVTGVLLYNDGNFMQCFEGSEQAVQLTYQRILGSRRHKDVIELLNEPIEQRSFSDWKMDFLRPTQAEWQELLSARWSKKGDEVQGSSSASEGFMLLQDFWKRSHRIA